MKTNQKHVVDVAFVLSLLCLFVICGLLVVFIGIQVYKGTAANVETTFSGRTAIYFITKQIRQNDRENGVLIQEIDGKQVLVLQEEIDESVFCKYIYTHDGYLCELYAKEEFEPVLTAGQELVPIKEFYVVENEDGTISITIEDEQGESHSLIIALRSK